MTSVIETAMCAKDYSGVDYSKLPSLASSRYQKAFLRNDEVGYGEYKTALESGEAKVNAGAVYPYDIIKSMNYGGDKVVNNAQWESLPNFMEGSEERVLPVVDVSGSMSCSAGGNDNLTCMDVAISLGMYISERNEGNFKDAFVTFSTNPKLEILKGSLSDRYRQLSRANWSMSTDLEKALKVILSNARAGNVPQSEMPTMLMILSDMQFNSACGGGGYSRGTVWNPTALEMTKEMYAEAGYKMPKIVYWNLAGRGENTPVKSNDTGTALVSGFSPSLLLSLLSGKDISPYSMMMDVVNSERYSKITV